MISNTMQTLLQLRFYVSIVNYSANAKKKLHDYITLTSISKAKKNKRIARDSIFLHL